MRLKTKPFITDTSTLYTGRRHNAIDHTVLATERGFGVEGLGIPFIAPDGLVRDGRDRGADRWRVGPGSLDRGGYCPLPVDPIGRPFHGSHAPPVPGRPSRRWAWAVRAARARCGSTRPSSRRLRRASVPAAANVTGIVPPRPFRSTRSRPISTRTSASVVPSAWRCAGSTRSSTTGQQENSILQKSVAEHALGPLKGKEGRAVFFNFLLSMTKDCDCFDQANMPTMVQDIGILASTDPVAVDQAAIDLVETRGGRKLPAADRQQQVRLASSDRACGQDRPGPGRL